MIDFVVKGRGQRKRSTQILEAVRVGELGCVVGMVSNACFSGCVGKILLNYMFIKV